MEEKIILSNGKEFKRSTQRKNQSFNDFQVDFIKQFSAFDIMMALKKTLENKENDYHRVKKDNEEEANIWFIKEVIYNLGFFNTKDY